MLGCVQLATEPTRRALRSGGTPRCTLRGCPFPANSAETLSGPEDFYRGIDIEYTDNFNDFDDYNYKSGNQTSPKIA